MSRPGAHPWNGQTVRNALARKAIGKRHPATIADLRAAVAKSEMIPVVRLPPGPAMVSWFPSWWGQEAGMPEAPKPKPKRRNSKQPVDSAIDGHWADTKTLDA